jgi:eukaryotic-like serine/threonine-protein kinase
MASPRPSPASENSEEARAFLQIRVALFWKVLFLITLLSCGFGAVGAVAKPGVDFVIVLVLTAQAGIFWWLCHRGQRSVSFSRAMESGGLLFNLIGGAFLGRYFFASFARDHSLVTSEGLLMGDGYVSMLQQGGTAMMVAIRAALIPSSPRRTILVTALVGTPMLVANTVVIPSGGGLAWRPLDSGAYPWMPVGSAMMWGFAILTATVTSWVIYGLRAEVREARRLGQYVLEHKIGEGGMGEVYRARHGMMRRPSAIKLMRSDIAGEEGIARFEREVQQTTRLTHPNTITIFDYGRTNDGIFYYVMELLDGATLERVVAVDGPQSPARVVRILTMACSALSEAHAIGLIHRDIKPANIMLCQQGGERDVVKLLDFGLVKELEVDGAGDVAPTGTNTITGTPQYMAPEAILRANAADARTDIYALGAVAYYLLAGRTVFVGTSLVEICGHHIHTLPERFSASGVAVPTDLEAVVLACLEKDPTKRPQTALDLRRQLEACTTVDPWTSEDAQTWWSAHQGELTADADTSESLGEARTVDVKAR